MKNIEIKSGCVVYYGNPAGYIHQGIAVVDTMFQSPELESWLCGQKLTAEWTDGVYDRLANGIPPRAGENAAPLKACRVWQLKPYVDIRMKFIGYEEMVRDFGEPKPEDYRLVYDGQLETNDLEGIYSKFNYEHPRGFTGHSLSLSDVVELYDHTGSEFHYVDRRGFQKIGFSRQEQAETPGMTMSV